MGVGIIGPVASGGGGKIQKIEKITSTQSWTAPSDVTSVHVTMCGGGGGGGSQENRCTGGAGSVDFNTINVTPGQAYTITIGAGGAAGIDGANSSFGGIFTVLGGDSPFRENATVLRNLGGGGGSASNSVIGGPGGSGYRGLGGGGGGSGHEGAEGGGAGSSGAGSGAGEAGPTDAAANTGGGGGGGNLNYFASSGGSGVAILEYWSGE